MKLLIALLSICALIGCASIPAAQTYIPPEDGPIANLSVTTYTQGLYFGGRNPEIIFWNPEASQPNDMEIGKFKFHHKEFGVQSIRIRAEERGYFSIRVSEAGDSCSVPFSFTPKVDVSYKLHFELKNFKCSIEIRNEEGQVIPFESWKEM